MSDFTASRSLAEPARNIVDPAAQTVHDSIQAVEQSTHEALDKTADLAEALRRQTASPLEWSAGEAQKLIQQGREVVQDPTRRARDQATAVADGAISYTKESP